MTPSPHPPHPPGNDDSPEKVDPGHLGDAAPLDDSDFEIALPDASFAETNSLDEGSSGEETTAEFGPEWKRNMVAYLDGELSERDMQDLDDLLVSDSDARSDAEQLRQTWDLLDVLPRPMVADEFSAQTLATIQAVKDDAPPEPSPWRQRGLLAIVWLLLLSASGVAGVWLSDYLNPDSTTELMANLPVLERLDQYQSIGDLTFVESLAETGRFPRSNVRIDDQTVSILEQDIPDGDPLRWAYLEDLTEDGRNRLRKNRSAYQDLDPAEKAEMKRLDRRLSSSRELAAVAADFYEWLKSLRPWQRAEVQDLVANTPRRIQLIEKLLDEEEQRLLAQAASNRNDWGSRLGRGPTLSRDGLDRVIREIEKRLAETQQQELAKQRPLPRISHAVVVLELSINLAAMRSGPIGRQGTGNRPQGVRWPGLLLSRAIHNQIPDQRVRTFLESAENARQTSEQTGMLILRSMAQQFLQDAYRDQPSEEELTKVLAGLKGKQHFEFIRMPPREQSRRLREFHYQQTHPNALPDGITRFNELVKRVRL